MNDSPERAQLRRLVHGLLITVAVAMAWGRIGSAQLVVEPDMYRDNNAPEAPGRKWPDNRPRPMATFSSNDRSRWVTVRTLVDQGTFVVGHRDPSAISPTNKYGDVGPVFEDGWQTVDKVMKPGTNEFYSTKPPLLTILVAGEYWVLKHLFGWTLEDDPFLVVRFIVFTINGLGWLFYLLLLAELLERFGATDFGRLYVMTAACFGTLMTPFLISLNNHTVATVCVLAVLWLLATTEEKPLQWWKSLLVGLLSGFTICNELPAAAFAGVVGVYLLWREPRQMLCFFLPGLLIPIGAFFWTNYLAVGQWRPVYAEFGSEWYRYPGSHWVPDPSKRGIDWAGLRETRWHYAFHVLLGHHGLFSLTPIFLLSFVGFFFGTWRLLAKKREPGEGHTPSWGELPSTYYLFPLALVVSGVVIGFYLVKSDNYGGWTSGPRWLMWLTPLWLLAMLPVVDRLATHRAGRLLLFLMLAVSVGSMSYHTWNPWRHPWIYRVMESQGWIPY